MYRVWTWCCQKSQTQEKSSQLKNRIYIKLYPAIKEYTRFVKFDENLVYYRIRALVLVAGKSSREIKTAHESC